MSPVASLREIAGTDERSESVLTCAGSVKGCTGQRATIHQLTTMLSTSKNVLYPGHNQLPSPRAIIKMSGHQHRWLAGG